jgi:enamine deaminase RidA (YjgF/YER057c/UK114 family)
MSREPVSADVDTLGPYSPAIVAEGRFVYVSGQGAIRAGRYEGGSVADETRLAIENLFRILEEAGCSPADVVRCGVYLTDMAWFDQMNAAYEELFPRRGRRVRRSAWRRSPEASGSRSTASPCSARVGIGSRPVGRPRSRACRTTCGCSRCGSSRRPAVRPPSA